MHRVSKLATTFSKFCCIIYLVKVIIALGVKTFTNRNIRWKVDKLAKSELLIMHKIMWYIKNGRAVEKP